MTEAKWRLLLGGQGVTTEPMTAAQIATWLWTDGGAIAPWAERLDGAAGQFADELPEVRTHLLQDAERLAAAWLGSVGPAGECHWSFLWLTNLCAHYPEGAWAVLGSIVKLAPDSDLPAIGAGPLEELLTHHGSSVISRVEVEAATNPRFHAALRCVWQSEISAEVWQRVQHAAGRPIGP